MVMILHWPGLFIRVRVMVRVRVFHTPYVVTGIHANRITERYGNLGNFKCFPLSHL